jgi:hypothetical protein
LLSGTRITSQTHLALLLLVLLCYAVPQQELLLLLATGACTPPLQSFLCSSLGEAGLRRLARGTDAALNVLHTALLERLVPLAELVVFLLGELRGAVLAAGAETWMGLQVGVVCISVAFPSTCCNSAADWLLFLPPPPPANPQSML